MRTVRRPTFQPAPEPAEEDGDSTADEPIFSDEPAVPVAGLAASGPVETRPHWTARNERLQGRRLAQLRRSSGEARGTPRVGTTGMLPSIASGYIRDEIRQILITTAVMVAVLVVLTFALR